MAKKQKLDWKVLCTGLASITLIELYALYLGHDGILLTLVIGAICAILGITIPTPNIFKSK